MPTLAVTNFNIVLSLLGGWISLFGLVSYLCKENFYLSEALISMLAGVAFSPPGANFIRPLEYAQSQANLDAVTLYFSRLVLGVQLVLAGVQLPSRYLKQHWRPLSILLGPIMAAMWLSTSLLVWALVPHMTFLHALAVGSCVTPTDPILSNVIVKGRYADKNVPVELQNIIVAESGANDGLGYPFLFFALYLIQYTGFHETAEFPVPGGGAKHAMGLWFGETWGYTILLSVVYGTVVGYLAKELLHWAKKHHYVDHESFLAFAISLALFITGTCGMIGSDDVLACFIAGNVFTWDDWFRLETKDDSLQPTIDMLLNVTIFMWYGAVCPWELFVHGPVPIYRLIGLGIVVLVLRRLPWILAIHKFIPQIENLRHALFVGFFGPVGVSAVFYLYITVEFLENLSPKGEHEKVRPDVAHLSDTVRAVVWFICMCSVVVHGLSIPLGKLGFYIPRTISRALPAAMSKSAGGTTSNGDYGMPFHLGSRVNTMTLGRFGRSATQGSGRQGDLDANTTANGLVLPVHVGDVEDGSNQNGDPSTGLNRVSTRGSGSGSHRKIYRIGGSIIRSNSHPHDGSVIESRFVRGDIVDEELGIEMVKTKSNVQEKQVEVDQSGPSRQASDEEDGIGSGSSTPARTQQNRTIRFPDEPRRN